MRVISCEVENFASYKHLSFYFDGKGLMLIHGATGSGKSTLCDIIPWCLFGRTSKGGAVDEVLNWSGGVAKVTLNLEDFVVVRFRGKNAKDNDLFYSEKDSPWVHRGKDLLDTQKLLNQRLGLDYDTYMAGSYFHEFSPTASFFTTTAKNRRTICEQIVDLDLAKKLQLKITESKKVCNDQINTYANSIQTYTNSIQMLERMQENEKHKASHWLIAHENTKKLVAAQYHKFENNRTQVISKNCPMCKTVLVHKHKVTNDSENPYLTRLAELEVEVNPHSGSMKDFLKEIIDTQGALVAVSKERKLAQASLNDYEALEDISTVLRTSLITNTISFVQDSTNQLLSTYFDAELKVEFVVEDADKLDVTIYKDGNICSYTQLSKGQRQLLRLCFGISVMKQVANHSGVTVQQLFFDEALDGLDETLKVKSYRLLESLSQEYDSVFVAEHSSALKEMFTNKTFIQLIEGRSQIEEA